MIGYRNIPVYWKQGLAEVEPMNFKYTTISLNDVYDMSYRHALEMIARNGGEVKEDHVNILTENPRPVKYEKGFAGHYPAEMRTIRKTIRDSLTLQFVGNGFVLQGQAKRASKRDTILKALLFLDGKLMETSELPTNFTIRKYDLFWKYNLPMGKHSLKVVVLNANKASIYATRLLVYSNQPLIPKY